MMRGAIQCNGVTVREIAPEFPRWAVVAGSGGGTQGGNACGAPRGPHTSRLIDGGSMAALPGHCPWAAYLASTSALSGRHQASLSRYQSMVACRPERKSVNLGAQPSSWTSLELSMA